MIVLVKYEYRQSIFFDCVCEFVAGVIPNFFNLWKGILHPYSVTTRR